MLSPVPFRRNLFLVTPLQRGDDVLAVQRLLAGTAVSLDLDGFFGSQTQSAVQAFQARRSLRQDGVVGRATWEVMFPSSSAITGPMTAEPNSRHCFEAFQRFNWTAEQACGLVANIKHESDFNPNAVGDGGSAYGIAQWHPPRQAAFRALKQRSIIGSSIDDQLDFVQHELTQGEERGAGQRLKAARTPHEAGDIVSRFYERPAAREAEALARGRTAELYFQAFQGGPAPAPSTIPVTLPDRTASDILSPRVVPDLLQPHSFFPGGLAWWLTHDGISRSERPASVGADDVQHLTALWQRHSSGIASALSQIAVPVELVLALLGRATPPPDGIRLLLGCNTRDAARTPDRVRAGLLQVLLSAARTGLNRPDLTLKDLSDPETALRAGARHMWLQGVETGFDPPLVVAAYMAGGLYYDATPANRWRLMIEQPGSHATLERFIDLFNAAMDVTRSVEVPDAIPSFHELIESAAVPTASATQGPYIAPDADGWIGRPPVDTGECVALVQKAASAPLTKFWRRGEQAMDVVNLQRGTAIATFGADGRYGNRTDGQSHAALFLERTVEGLSVVDQWNRRENGVIVGHQEPHQRVIRFGAPDKPKVDQGEEFFVIV